MTARSACLAVIAVVAGGCAGMMAENQRHIDNMNACDRGDAKACLYVGRMWQSSAENGFENEDHAPDREKAIVAYDRACGGGLGDACTEGADMFLATASTYENQHPEVYERMDARACELGNNKRCLARVGRMMPNDPARPVVLRAVCARSVDGCVDGARLGGTDPALAFELARHPCDVRAVTQCSDAASLDLADSDRDTLLAASCDLGTGKDCFTLGERELARPELHDQALDHYRRACKLDIADACTRVGQLLSGASPAP